MSENQSSLNKILNRQKLALFSSEGEPALYKMIKGSEEFYFDSTDLLQRQPEFDQMGDDGWILVERVMDLPAYIHARLQALDEARFEESGWGYKKKTYLVLDVINESVNELITEQLTKARLAGQTTIRVRINLSELAKLVAERLNGLHAAEFVIPSIAKLQNYWLPMITKQIGGSVDSDGTIELDVRLPPPRHLHAR